MKILLLTQWFDPEPTLKGLVFARELKRQGHDVQVLTGFPNYPGGKIYSGYKLKFKETEFIEGIEVTRVALYPSHDSSALKRIFNYISFAFMALLFGLFATKKVDVIYAYHPPLTVGIAAILIKFFRRIPVVYDIQDMWPDTLQATGMLNNKKILNFIGYICNIVYKYVDHIVVLSPGFKKLLIERKVKEEKISIIYNWCNEEELKNKVELKEDYSDIFLQKFNLIFAGNLGKAQGLDTLVEVADKLKANESIQFIFVGDGTEKDHLINQVYDRNLKNVLFIPRVPMSEVGGILEKADVLIVHLKDDKLFQITIPSKTQAYMAIGKPILMAVKGDASDIIKYAQAGAIAQPENIESILKAINYLYESSSSDLIQMGVNSKKYYMDNMSLEKSCEKFIDVFEMVRRKENSNV
ncbi:glycosyltransferase family 4 protein [Acinetobacter sp. YH12239]|uniref:glycosyltransferase family 4 protein n=1 Tax=Acinetobacter sp. YH12239 TaxID=2601166 RepID=UPI0015D39ACB|nr:glycosyltransferase family 4 protein [Acinetobacter sp. YH12239]